nr:hypothetical protein [Tanacetum cinerariifolium]
MLTLKIVHFQVKLSRLKSSRLLGYLILEDPEEEPVEGEPLEEQEE